MTVMQAEDIKRTYAEAMQKQTLGEDREALRLFGRILREKPRLTEVHFQLARIFLRNDRLPVALKHIRIAASLKPEVMDIWRVWADVVSTLSDEGERKSFLDTLEKSPIKGSDRSQLRLMVDFKRRSNAVLSDVSEADVERIRNLITQGRPEEAEKLAAAAVKRHPKSEVMHNLLAVALASQGRNAEALTAVEKSIEINPRFDSARVNAAQIQKALGRKGKAMQQCNIALRLSPAQANTLLFRSELFRDLNALDEAKADVDRYVDAGGDRNEAALQRARVLYDEHKFFEVEDLLKAHVDGLGGRRDYHLLLSNAFIEQGRDEEALEEVLQILAKTPDDQAILSKVGSIYQTLGQFDDARAAFKKSMRIDPRAGEPYRSLVVSNKLERDDPMVEEMKEHFADETIQPESRARFGFALAKVYEDWKEYDKVFDYLHPANKIMNDHYRGGSASRMERQQLMLDLCQNVDWGNIDLPGDSDFAPIFIVGMPRSGTTLTEQILSSHSRVVGAGESGIANAELLSITSDEYRNVIPAGNIPPEDFRKLAAHYEGYMKRLYPGCEMTTDKSMGLQPYIGMLKMAFPKAKFVIIRRDPRDNLLSMYKNVFADGAQTFTYNLTNLAEHYKMFVKFVNFWKEVRPDWVYELHYEKLTADPEVEVPKLIEACGLEWEDACLNFHENKRRVKTLSVYQVRQPMYRTSTKAWERYGDALDELMEALGPEYLPDDPA